MVKKLFGTDGVRGRANTYPMTAEISMKLGQAAAVVLAQHKKVRNRENPKVILGKDTRLSGYIFEMALTSGLCSMGVDVYMVGPMPTPAIAHLTKSFAADAGIVISASHNPAVDNGIKFFGCDGFKLPDNIEDEIEKLVLGNNIAPEKVPFETVGKAYRISDAHGRYVEYCKNTVSNTKLRFKIVLDCANGAAYKVAPLVFRELGSDVIVVGDKPDGLNINKGCGAICPDLLKKEVLLHKADVGIALDGDADRVVMADENGDIVDGDEIMAMSARYLKECNELKNDAVVATVMSNIGLQIAMMKYGVKVLKTQVGDRYVIEEMRRIGACLGGEQSGHIIFSRHSTTGDGVISALQVLRIMKHYSRKLSELKKIMKKYPQVLTNVDVKEKIPFENIVGLNEKIAEISGLLADKGRLLVRYSGTQNCCRVMIEGEDEKVITGYANQIIYIIKKQIGDNKY